MSDGGLRRLFRNKFNTWQWSSIETSFTASGIPDSEFCAPEGEQGWIEFKWTKIHYVQIKPMQVAWLMRRYRLNKRAFIAVRRTPSSKKERGVDELWLMDGGQAEALFYRGLNGVSALCWSGGPNSWNYIEIGEVLTKGFNP